MYRATDIEARRPRVGEKTFAVTETHSQRLLVCRVGGVLCGIPLAHVVETLRPLPIEAVAGAPSGVLGMAILRGSPVPVVSGHHLVAGGSHPARRFVVLRASSHRVALAVDDVVGFFQPNAASLGAVPSLLRNGSSAVTEIGALDGALALVLDATRILPEEVLAVLQVQRLAS